MMDGQTPTSTRAEPRPAAVAPVYDLSRRIAAEALGTALLLAIIIGSGVMGERLAQGNVAIALLANAIATGAGLVVLISILRPISGAHFNPAVTLVFALRREVRAAEAALYAIAQCAGAIIGVWAAHLMFAEPILQVSTTGRDGASQGFSEAVAAFGLIMTILGAQRFNPQATAMLVGLYITAAYWFTASTSFANPAVTIARSMSDTFAGIAPGSALEFVAAQLAGALAALGFMKWLLVERR
jgi:glycerol uptake facilitator-like aquaporin